MLNENKRWMSLWTSFIDSEARVNALISELKMEKAKPKGLSTIEKAEKHKRRKRAAVPTDQDLEMMIKPGSKEMRQAAIGVFEGEEEIEEDCVGNPYHSGDTGRFTSPREGGSWSKEDKDCAKKGQYKRSAGSRSPGSTSAPCGRKNRSKLCRDGKKRRSEGLLSQDAEQDETMTAAQLADVVRNIVRQELHSFREFQRKHKGGCSLGEFLRAQDALARSEKGDLKKRKG